MRAVAVAPRTRAEHRFGVGIIVRPLLDHVTDQLVYVARARRHTHPLPVQVGRSLGVQIIECPVDRVRVRVVQALPQLSAGMPSLRPHE